MKMYSALGVFMATIGGAAFIALNPVDVAAGTGNNISETPDVFAGQQQVNDLVAMVLPPYKWAHE